MDMEKWLRGLGLQQYAAAFRDNAVDAEILPELTDVDLEKLCPSRIIATSSRSDSTSTETSPRSIACAGLPSKRSAISRIADRSPSKALSSNFRERARKWRGSLPAQISTRSGSANGLCPFKEPTARPIYPLLDAWSFKQIHDGTIMPCKSAALSLVRLNRRDSETSGRSISAGTDRVQIVVLFPPVAAARGTVNILKTLTLGEIRSSLLMREHSFLWLRSGWGIA